MPGRDVTIEALGDRHLADSRVIAGFLLHLCDALGMSLISLSVHDMWADRAREPGVSGALVLAESGGTLHTYPEAQRYDLYIHSCRDFDPGVVQALCRQTFGGVLLWSETRERFGLDQAMWTRESGFP